MGEKMGAVLKQATEAYSVMPLLDLQWIAADHGLLIKNTVAEQSDVLADAVLHLVIYIPEMVDAMHADGFSPPQSTPSEALAKAHGVVGDVRPTLDRWD